ncbi:tail fiber domain-containing protein [Chryseobacterium sp. Marseille-Q3244]|uniref:tail fiber domain-containing protein n=1 Tax=Chryseobacterium sp. Marseille-Q3244 TaxID=2758092 RepID=UPI002023F37E|nr:tail fiber domain-containing protein [Chryseobacterium sp. Marseille-Q3244]
MKPKIIFKNYFYLILLTSAQLYSQVGINTNTPEATLDILSKGNTASTKAVRINNSNNTEMITVTDAGRVDIGKVNPAGSLQLATTDVMGIISERSSNSTTGAHSYLILRRNNSTNPSVNGAVVSAQALGAVLFSGNSGDGYNETGAFINMYPMIIAYATQNFSATAQGAELRFLTTTNGTTTNAVRMTIANDGKVGIGRVPATNILEIAGEASKNTAGSWVANSDVRLKKDVQQISSNEALDKLLKLKGVYYYWNDNNTGISRPKEKQMGFIAQNIQEIFPDKVTTDSNGYLQTAYGDYDAILVEAVRALHQKNQNLESRITELEKRLKK